MKCHESFSRRDDAYRGIHIIRDGQRRLETAQSWQPQYRMAVLCAVVRGEDVVRADGRRIRTSRAESIDQRPGPNGAQAAMESSDASGDGGQRVGGVEDAASTSDFSSTATGKATDMDKGGPVASRLVSSAAARQASPLPCLARAFATTSSMLSASLLMLRLLRACGICCCSAGERCARSLAAADTPTLPPSPSPARFGCDALLGYAAPGGSGCVWRGGGSGQHLRRHPILSPFLATLACLALHTYYRLSALPDSVLLLFFLTVHQLTATTDMLLPAANPNTVAPSATSSTSATATSLMLLSSTQTTPSRCW